MTEHKRAKEDGGEQCEGPVALGDVGEPVVPLAQRAALHLGNRQGQLHQPHEHGVACRELDVKGRSSCQQQDRPRRDEHGGADEQHQAPARDQGVGPRAPRHGGPCLEDLRQAELLEAHAVVEPEGEEDEEHKDAGGEDHIKRPHPLSATVRDGRGEVVGSCWAPVARPPPRLPGPLTGRFREGGVFRDDGGSSSAGKRGAVALSALSVQMHFRGRTRDRLQRLRLPVPSQLLQRFWLGVRLVRKGLRLVAHLGEAGLRLPRRHGRLRPHDLAGPGHIGLKVGEGLLQRGLQDLDRSGRLPGARLAPMENLRASLPRWMLNPLHGHLLHGHLSSKSTGSQACCEGLHGGKAKHKNGYGQWPKACDLET
mmetsp:Transcript_89606/g.261961  ORF Transcript_89606/g.261961 Transcript_89606/m.261961 type:complete len:368 (+) Transcript_89606:276-1379(+)